jgi:hypothetical protein
MAQRRIFLSAVSNEFESHRRLLAHDLKRPNVDVKEQEEIAKSVGGGTTLEKLDDYIRDCDAVIHLIGDATGDIAEPASGQAILRRYPDLRERLVGMVKHEAKSDPERVLVTDPTALSYTQWEAYLAIYHRKPLHIYRPAPDAPRDPRFQPNEQERQLQQQHYARI